MGALKENSGLLLTGCSPTVGEGAVGATDAVAGAPNANVNFGTVGAAVLLIGSDGNLAAGFLSPSPKVNIDVEDWRQ